MINRDGTRTSLWQDVDPFTPINTADNATTYDVIIAGGGITGLSTALVLQEAGKKCLVLEAANLCFGTTGGTTAHLNTLVDTPYTTISNDFGKDGAKLVARATAQAIQLVKRNISTYNIDCGFKDRKGYVFSQDEKQTKDLQDIQAATAEAGVACSLVNELPIPVPYQSVMVAEGQADFHPVNYVFGLAKAFEAAGGVIVENCRVESSEDKEPLKVITTRGEFLARALIYATHIPPSINFLDLRLSPYRSYAIAVKLQSEEYPEDLYYDMYDPYNYYRTQEVNGEKYFIVGGADHKTAHEDNTEKCFRNMESLVRKYFDVKETAFQWSSQFYEPTDGLPYIGHLPGHPNNVFVATGFSGNGMVYSHVSAIVLKSIILKEESPYISLFSPSRVKPVAGFKEFVAHNVDVAKQFVSKWFAYDKIQELADLAPGEGRLVKYNDEKIALYKDEQSNLHAVNPTCAHMKCSVSWNIAEKSWDCPCHGARYNVKGEVVTGPANNNLEQIDIRKS
jgi:glycine/D-amino acid oxidase-like deaminating enzyme/nitrite reductase/ring-hydroxylating ferredoxin subunit